RPAASNTRGRTGGPDGGAAAADGAGPDGPVPKPGRHSARAARSQRAATTAGGTLGPRRPPGSNAATGRTASTTAATAMTNAGPRLVSAAAPCARAGGTTKEVAKRTTMR